MAESLGDLRATIGFDVDTKALADLTKALQGVSASVDKLSSQMGGQDKAARSAEAAHMGLRKGATALAAGVAAAGAAIGVATKAAVDYDAAMAEVATLTPEVADNMGRFKEEVLGVSAALGQDAVTSTNALYNAISAGIPPDNAVSFLETAGKAAVAGVSDINTAVGALSVGLNAYNLDATEAGRVSDALFTGVKLGVTTFGELGSSLGKVAGIAASSGATIEQTVGTLAQITTKGFSTAEAVTALKATFVSLSKPSKEVQAALEAQGFASAKAAIEAEGLQYVMELVRQVADDTGKPLISLVGSADAVNAVLATTGDNAAAAREKVDAFGQTMGATGDAFSLIEQTPAQQIAVFREQINAAKIAVGDAFLPVLGSLLQAVTPLIEKFSAFARETLAPLAQRFTEMPESGQRVVAVLGGLAAAGGTLAAGLTAIAGFLGPVVSGLGLLGGAAGAGGAAGGVGVLAGAGGALGTALSALAGPLGIVLAVTAGLGIAAFKAGAAQREQFLAVQESGGAFGSYVEAARSARDEAGLFGKVGFFARDAWASFKDVLTNFLATLAPVVDTLKSIGGAVGGFLGGLGEKVGLDLSFPEPSETGAIRDAAMAYLELERGYDAAVLKSGEFKTAQAQAALQLEQGQINAVEYKNALETAAGAVARRSAEAQLDAEAAAGQSSAYADLTASATQYSSVMVDANGNIITAAQQRAAAEADAAQQALSTQQTELDRLVTRGEMEQATADSIMASRQRAVDNMVANLAITESTYDAERSAMLAVTDGTAAMVDSRIAANASMSSSMQATAADAQASIDSELAALGLLDNSHMAATDSIVSGQKMMQGEFAATGSAGATSFGSLDEELTDTAAGMVQGAADVESSMGVVRDAFGNIIPGAQQLSTNVGGAFDTVTPKVRGFADETERAAQAQARAQSDAAGTATAFGDDTVEAFHGVSSQAIDTSVEVGELQASLEGLPPEVVTAYVLTGVPEAREMLKAVNMDLQGIAETIRFSLVGTYVGTGGAEKESPMAVLKDVWALRDESSLPFAFRATYSGTGATDWTGRDLAINQSLADLYDQTSEPITIGITAEIDRALQLLLFDSDFEAAALQAAQEELERLGLAADEAGMLLARMQAQLDSWTPKVIEEIEEFFGGEFQGALAGANSQLIAAIEAAFAHAKVRQGIEANPELADLLNSFRDLFTLDEGFFGEYGILDPETLLPFESLDQARARIAELFRGTPEQQAMARDLWDLLSSGLEDAITSASQQGIEALNQYRASLGDSQLGEDLETPFGILIEAMGAAQDLLDETLEDQTDGVETQLEIYDRLIGMVNERMRAEEEARRAIEAANRELERQIKDRQKAAEEAEKLAHDQVMDAIEDEIDAREDAYDRELRAIDKRRDALEAEIERLTKLEEDRHAERMAAITAEVDAEQARIDQQEAALKEAGLLLDAIERGDEITDEQRDLLESLGIDPDRIAESNEGLSKTRRLVDDLNDLISDLPSKREYTTLDEAQRDALQRALDQGLIPESQRRVVEVALAGKRVRGDVLRDILSGVVDEAEGQVEQAESYLDLIRQQLAAEKDRLDLAELTNDKARTGLEDQLEAERQRHEQWKDNQADRLAALDAERDALEESWRVWKEAADAAKEAERDRHDARMEQLQREYALQLLQLGLSDEEVAAELARQAERAAKIADEAAARFRKFLAELDANRQAIEAEEARMPGGGAGLVRGPSLRRQPGVNPVLPPPGGGGVPGPGLPPITDMLGMVADGAGAAGDAMRRGFLDPTTKGLQTLMMVADQTSDALSALPITNPGLASAISRGANVNVNTDNRRNQIGTLIVGQGDPREEGILDAIGVSI